MMLSKLVLLAVVAWLPAVAYAQPQETPFSKLPAERQTAFRDAAEPPPLAERRGPYSVPMYYLFHAGSGYTGDEDRDPENRCYPSMKGKAGPDFGKWSIDRNRPDWQETIIANWAELGLNSTHLNIYPQGGALTLEANYVTAIEDFVRLSEKYGLRVGVRLDALDETRLWSVHPANPQSRRSEYLRWATDVARLLKGRTAYYVLGDELTLKKPEESADPKSWTAPMYLDYFRALSTAIKTADPDAKVCMFAASSGEWFNVLWLLENGYAQLGDGVAINHYDYSTVGKFFDDRNRLAPGKLFLTSGVGYISNGLVTPRYPEGDAYSPAASEAEHAARIAKTMFTWWDLGADNAPYYLSLRNWVKDETTYPRWFGFFGFEDFVIDHDELTIKRYPGWYAYQSIANTFYNRAELKPLENEEVLLSQPVTVFKAFERRGAAGDEIIAIVWNDAGPVDLKVTLRGKRFGHPVRVSLSNFRDWSDLPAERHADQLRISVAAGVEPMIFRLFSR